MARREVCAKWLRGERDPRRDGRSVDPRCEETCVGLVGTAARASTHPRAQRELHILKPPQLHAGIVRAQLVKPAAGDRI